MAVAAAGAGQLAPAVGASGVLALANGSQLVMDLFAHRSGRWKQRLGIVTLLDGLFTLAYGAYLAFLGLVRA